MHWCISPLGLSFNPVALISLARDPLQMTYGRLTVFDHALALLPHVRLLPNWGDFGLCSGGSSLPVHRAVYLSVHRDVSDIIRAVILCGVIMGDKSFGAGEHISLSPSDPHPQ